MEPLYLPSFVRDPDQALIELRDQLEWERRGDAPRCEYYCNDFSDPYTYGRGIGKRTYLPRPYHARITEIRQKLESELSCKFEVCFLNLYLDQRDHLGWHADDSPEMDDTRPVVSVSLGAEREIHTRVKDDVADRQIRRYMLEHGSAFVMPPGFQDLYQHKIPKSSAICGQRVSLTFRGYVKNGPTPN